MFFLFSFNISVTYINSWLLNLFGGFMAVLPLARVEKLIRKAGAERVSRDASKELGLILEERAVEISAKAVKMAKHAGRKTVTEKDIRLAR